MPLISNYDQILSDSSIRKYSENSRNNHLRHKCLIYLYGFLTGLMPLIFPVSAHAQPKFASVVCVKNDTSYNISIQNAWHKSSAWGETRIPSKETRLFVFTYSRPDENQSPYFLLGVYTSNQGKLNYHVNGTASTATDSCKEASMVYIKQAGNNFYVEGDNIGQGHWDDRTGSWTRYKD